MRSSIDSVTPPVPSSSCSDDDVRLLEVRLVGVEHDRLARAQRMVEQRRESRVPPLEHPRGVLRRRLLGGVVVDVEVRRAQDFELELLVLHLVAAEVLRAGREAQPASAIAIAATTRTAKVVLARSVVGDDRIFRMLRMAGGVTAFVRSELHGRRATEWLSSPGTRECGDTLSRIRLPPSLG